MSSSLNLFPPCESSSLKARLWTRAFVVDFTLEVVPVTYVSVVGECGCPEKRAADSKKLSWYWNILTKTKFLTIRRHLIQRSSWCLVYPSTYENMTRFPKEVHLALNALSIIISICLMYSLICDLIALSQGRFKLVASVQSLFEIFVRLLSPNVRILPSFSYFLNLSLFHLPPFLCHSLRILHSPWQQRYRYSLVQTNNTTQHTFHSYIKPPAQDYTSQRLQTTPLHYNIAYQLPTHKKVQDCTNSNTEHY